MDVSTDVLAYLSKIRRGLLTVADKIDATAEMVDPDQVVEFATHHAANRSRECIFFVWKRQLIDMNYSIVRENRNFDKSL